MNSEDVSSVVKFIVSADGDDDTVTIELNTWVLAGTVFRVTANGSEIDNIVLPQDCQPGDKILVRRKTGNIIAIVRKNEADSD